MKCLVINLDRSSGRLAHATAEFARIGVDFERVAAIEGHQRPELASMSPSLALSEIGAFLSHRACWQLIAEGTDAYCAIFEDDVVFTKEAGRFLSDGAWIPADADIVKIETFFRKAVISIKRHRDGPDYSVHRLYGLHLGACGYVISRQAARELLESTQSNDDPIDHVLFDPASATFSDSTIYQLSPALCAQSQFLVDKAAELPSEVEVTRLAHQQRRELAKQRSNALLAKFKFEAKRFSRQISNLFRLRQERTIPFDYRGVLIRRPTT